LRQQSWIANNRMRKNIAEFAVKQLDSNCLALSATYVHTVLVGPSSRTTRLGEFSPIGR
jgi:hypothetical protein